MEIIELPADSYFGEYQIILKLKSMFIYKSNEGEDTSTMCIKQGVLEKLLTEEYPTIKQKWEEEAAQRRREFQRLKLIAKEILRREFERYDHSPEDDDEAEEIPVKSLLDFQDEMAEIDFDDAIAGSIDKKERIPDKSQRVKANATKKAQQGLEIIEKEIDTFNTILEGHQSNFEHNLDQLSGYVKDSRMSTDKNLPVPEMLYAENSPSDILRNFVNKRQQQ